MTELTEVKNLLLIGRTGGGKSTLGNVLTNKNVFIEGQGSTSTTKNFENDDFEWQDTKYRVFDTIGIDDTVLSTEVVFYKIAEGINALKGGINQVLFVIGGKITKEERNAFNMFYHILDTSRILRFTTLVRTRFPNFRNPDKCREDRDAIFKENEEMFNSFRKIIYVDNPSMDIDDEVEKATNKKKREDSRKILMDYLRDECQATFTLKCWDILSLKYSSYFGRVFEFKTKKKKGENDELLELELDNAKNELIQEIGSYLETEIPEIKVFARKNKRNNNKSSCLLL
ncbi:unnamed protein product [Rhizophagus irregularis]|uniref:AIG1-type G domain-containing protein n=1 Tax=Rhizophagus irregularis TaxID=588596 RepID=A0A2N1MCN7_9GLOM|nr:hypothetical protein RhiirC2_762777 [Rhizophagus irregularis]CAB4386914.1 unnamed protein product [Rhizophagus irregularis]CAB5391085.1 unnamed protein product [Rhizophagus irregularis]